MHNVGGIRPLTLDDIPLWVSLAHESDVIVKNLISDITAFYDGFDKYMESKIRQCEAFMASAPNTGNCMGIIAFSRRNNRISFFGVSENFDLVIVGSFLLGFAMGQLDLTKDTFATILNSSHARIREEKLLYEYYGFIQNGTTTEAGVEALVMRCQSR